MKLTHVHILFFGKQNVKPLRREKANSQKYSWGNYGGDCNNDWWLELSLTTTHSTAHTVTTVLSYNLLERENYIQSFYLPGSVQSQFTAKLLIMRYRNVWLFHNAEVLLHAEIRTWPCLSAWCVVVHSSTTGIEIELISRSVGYSSDPNYSSHSIL